MKILVLGTRGIPNIQGGVETHCQELYPRLVKLGCNITILTRIPYVDNINNTDYFGVKLVHINTPTKSGLETIIHTLKGSIYAINHKKNIDLIHIHNIGPGIFIPLLKLFGFKVIVTYHSQNYHHKKWGILAKILFKLGELFSAKMANKIIYISKNIKNFIEKKYTVNNGRLILNGVNIIEKTTDIDYLNLLNLQANNYIIAVGRFVEEKGLHDLIEAYRRIDTDSKLVLVGNVDHESGYSLKLKETAKKNNIVLTGFIKGEQLNQIFSHARLFVMPSYHEGLPIALLEAMSYNLNVLVSDIPANLEVDGLEKEDYFKVGDVKDLQGKLAYKLQNTKQRNFLNIVQEKYNWDLIAKETKQLYLEVGKK